MRTDGDRGTDRLFFGIDWARYSDHTWVTIGNDRTDVVDWFKYPHVPYEQQVELIHADLYADRWGWRYIDRILAVRGDSTGGTGDAPNEMLMQKTGLPMGRKSFYQFTMQSKDALYQNFEAALFREPDDPLRFSYLADHPLASEFEEQMVGLGREYLGQGEYLSVHHGDEQAAVGDAPDSTALMLIGAAGGGMGNILIG